MELTTDLESYLTKRCLTISMRLAKRTFRHKLPHPYSWCGGRPLLCADILSGREPIIRILVICEKNCGYYIASLEKLPEGFINNPNNPNNPNNSNGPSNYRTAS